VGWDLRWVSEERIPGRGMRAMKLIKPVKFNCNLLIAIDFDLKEMKGCDCFTGGIYTGDNPFPVSQVHMFVGR